MAGPKKLLVTTTIDDISEDEKKPIRIAKSEQRRIAPRLYTAYEEVQPYGEWQCVDFSGSSGVKVDLIEFLIVIFPAPTTSKSASSAQEAVDPGSHPRLQWALKKEGKKFEVREGEADYLDSATLKRLLLPAPSVSRDASQKAAAPVASLDVLYFINPDEEAHPVQILVGCKRNDESAP